MQDSPNSRNQFKQSLLNHPAFSKFSRGIQQALRNRRSKRKRELDQRIEEKRYYDARLKDTLACPDNAFIPRQPDAGKIIDGNLVMHNGLLVADGSYYGHGFQRVMQANAGVHEPQEERVFAEVLKWIPEKATMSELGSYWAFYSMWFAMAGHERTNYMVEPEIQGLNMGKLNFLLNNLERGHFLNGFIGDRFRPSPPSLTCCL